MLPPVSAGTFAFLPAALNMFAQVVMITGDSDFSTIIHTMRNRKYTVILFHLANTSTLMQTAADYHFRVHSLYLLLAIFLCVCV